MSLLRVVAGEGGGISLSEFVGVPNWEWRELKVAKARYEA